jgi:hypothetical protein
MAVEVVEPGTPGIHAEPLQGRAGDAWIADVDELGLRVPGEFGAWPQPGRSVAVRHG